MTQENKEAQYREEFGLLSTEVLLFNIRAINPKWYLGPKVEKYIRITAEYMNEIYLNRYLAARKKGEEDMSRLRGVEQALYESEAREVRQHNKLKDNYHEIESLKKEIEELKKENTALNLSCDTMVEINCKQERSFFEENKKLRELVERAKPWVEKYPTSFGPDEGIQWLKEASEVLK